MAIGARKEWHNIDLICRAGLDVATLTPLLCRHIRQFVGAAATAIFWMDENGMPIGFHHEDSPASARDLFVNEFDRLFVGPSEINVATLAKGGGKSVGMLLSPDAAYFHSNTFNLLVRASGHHHALDLRVSVDNKVRIIVLLFREQSTSFTAPDAERLHMVEPCLLEALRTTPSPAWKPAGEKGQMIVDQAGGTLLFLNDAAEALLKECTLVGQGVSLTGPTNVTPLFIRDLCARASMSGSQHTSVIIPTGRLLATVNSMRAANETVTSFQPVVVTLERQVASSLQVIVQLMETKLSPVQRKIVLGASQGLGRSAVTTMHGLSNEAMKKHLAAIYSTVHANSWQALGEFRTL